MSLHKDIFSTMERLKSANKDFAIATIIVVKGSSSGKEGDKAVFDKNGKRVLGWIGGGCVENRVSQTVLEALVDGKTKIIDVNLDSDEMELGIPCGGIMTVFVEPQKQTPVLLVRGMGRVVESIVELCQLLNFKVIVQTPEEENNNVKGANKIITEPLDLDDIDETIDYFILATHHRDDHKQTLAAIDAGIPYVAVVASKKKADIILEFLKENKVTKSDLIRFHSPAGLDLKAKSPEEIALSIISEIVMINNGGTGKKMSV